MRLDSVAEWFQTWTLGSDNLSSVLTLLLTSCMILGEFFHFSETFIIIQEIPLHCAKYKKLSLRSSQILEAGQRLRGHFMQHPPFAEDENQGMKSQSRAKTRVQVSFLFNHEDLRSHGRGQITQLTLISGGEKRPVMTQKNTGFLWAKALGRSLVVSKGSMFRRKGKDRKVMPGASVTWSH